MASIKYITVDLDTDDAVSVVDALQKANLVSMVRSKGPYVVIARFGVNKTTLRKKILKKM